MAGLRKAFQRRLYTFLTWKWGMTIMVVGALVTLNSLMQLVYLLALPQHPPAVLPSALDQSGEDAPWPIIDVVYTWVNGSDERMQEQLHMVKLAAGLLGACNETHREGCDESSVATSSRFQDNDELRYSLRSIEKYAPWVRHVYVVTNGQVPSWLDLGHPRLTVVTHDEIFVNKSHLPTFSSPAIEAHLHRIPGLSQWFLYLNDDVMFGREVFPDDFYTESGGQKVYLSWPVPNCNDGCPSNWIGDGYCDIACNVSACQFDAGDCANVTGGSTFTGGAGGWWGSGAANTNSWGGGASSDRTSAYCARSCPDSWVGDRYCDRACENLECGFDAGDCGMDQIYADLPGFAIEASEGLEFELEPMSSASYFNLSSIIQNGTITDGSHDNADVVRTATISQKHKVMILTFHRDQPLQTVQLSVLWEDDEEHEITFNVTVTTKAITDEDDYDTEAESESGEDVSDPDQRAVPDADPIDVEGDPYNFADLIDFDAVRDAIANHEEDGGDAGEAGELEETAAGADYTEKGGREVEKGSNVGDAPEYDVRVERMMEGKDGEDDVTEASVPARLTALDDEGVRESVGATEEPEENHGADDDREAYGDERPQNGGNYQGRGLLSVEDSLEMVGAPNNNVTSIDDRVETDPSWHVQQIRNELMQMQKREPMLSMEELNELRRIRIATGHDGPVEYWPWEKHPGPTGRKLMDMFGESLKHVDALFNAEFGNSARKVPAHMPHMINKRIMVDLQDKFEQEFDKTSSNQLRSEDDMQYSFSYMYFMIHQKSDATLESCFADLDVDKSGSLNVNELRTLALRMNGHPLDTDKFDHLVNTLVNNTIEEGIIDIATIESTPEVSEHILEYYRNRPRNRHETLGTDEVAFLMVSEDDSTIESRLDGIRHRQHKFVCLNDNMNHSNPDAQLTVQILHEFYMSLFPLRSSFELPDGYRNRFLHMDELRAYKSQIYMWKVGLFVLCIASMLGIVYLLQDSDPDKKEQRKKKEERFKRLLRV